ncbi:hypothetical protein [Actinoplanes sp. CA-252034]|uniref:hypothetical protein n=1 Tax=Actinoplanes sp. CA-252034 TaxID=3239906 RepID=UPI003D970259
MAGPVSARAAVASNAAFSGRISVALPSTLAESGVSKAPIALSFASTVVDGGVPLLIVAAADRDPSPSAAGDRRVIAR